MDTITKQGAQSIELNIGDETLPDKILTNPYNKVQGKYYAYSKRCFDIVFSSLLILTVLSWLYPILFVLIRTTSRGKTLFIQRRMGRNGKIFYCYKFRTMTINDEADQLEATENDKRITWIGKILRNTYVDELPQLMNVLKGEMSIIGPRPHMLYHHWKFCMEIPGYDYRHQAKPGISGLAQIKGYNGSVSNYYSIYGRTKLDNFYVRKSSFGFDMKIVIGTIYFIFSSKNIK